MSVFLWWHQSAADVTTEKYGNNRQPHLWENEVIIKCCHVCSQSLGDSNQEVELRCQPLGSYRTPWAELGFYWNRVWHTHTLVLLFHCSKRQIFSMKDEQLIQIHVWSQVIYQVGIKEQKHLKWRQTTRREICRHSTLQRGISVLWEACLWTDVSHTR